MKKIFLALVGTMYLLMGCKKTISPEVSSEKLTDWVNPFIGTDGPGKYPILELPFLSV
ncbi:hypothetical protein CCAN11_2130022 [Capnocytophaga canimorsus]|uniref:Uncharacterized protein n=1 Tax=Capnocytophaga canimorsus TaxID=28188 RepID=A0A0B7IF23_9FLAO|nr:hypothetical protein CCAN11_2130022 [Capnocytophaga canimorsus]